MRINWKLFALTALLMVLAGCFPTSQRPTTPSAGPLSEFEVMHKGRRIDLLPYLEGFPYTISYVDLKSGYYFYMKKGNEQRLIMLKFDPESKDRIDLAKGKIISPRNFAERSFEGAFYDPASGKVIMLADENGDEHYNLYALDSDTGIERNLTEDVDVTYIYGYSLSPDGKTVAYSTRSGEEGASPGALWLLYLKYILTIKVVPVKIIALQAIFVITP